MKKLATLAAAALVAGGALTSSGAEARGRGGAVAAGLIGGLAAGALLGAAISDAQARPVGYGYGGYEGGYGGGYAPPYGYRPAPRAYADEPVYVSRRVYGERPAYDGYGYGGPRRWRRDCDRFDRGW